MRKTRKHSPLSRQTCRHPLEQYEETECKTSVEKHMAITARGTINGHVLTDIPVLNPGDWFGKAWLVEIGGSYSSLYVVIEADSMSDAIDELAEHEKYGHNIVVADEDLGDYDLEDCHYSGSGQVLDLDHLMFHGREVPVRRICRALRPVRRVHRNDGQHRCP